MPTKNIVAVHHFLVVLKMPEPEDAYINKTKGIFKATTDTTKFPVFPTGDPALNPRQFNINIQALDDAQSNLTTKPPLGTAKQRNDAKTVVHDNLESVRLGVQALVNASPKNAYTIAAKAGMEIKVITTHAPEKYRSAPEKYRSAPKKYRCAPKKYHCAYEKYQSAYEKYRSAPEKYRSAPEKYHYAPKKYHCAYEKYQNAYKKYRSAPEI
ncbi:MAG TPA: hypothetical protein VF411_10355 [Bacteroidia bacterium]